MWLLVAAVVLPFVGGCGGSGQQQEQEEEEGQTFQAALDAALEKSFELSAAPGVVAAVQTPEYTWGRALGVADLSSEKPMTPDVHQRIASVTKTFTTTLLLQAEADGLLSLEDTIDQYIEGVPNGDEITLRQMANMTSGIANYTEDERFLDETLSDPEQLWAPEEWVQMGIEDSPLFDPGSEWYYSNTNTLLLGLVLQQVTGEPIGELYRERIIEPLGLRETSFPDADSSIPDPHAQGYTLVLQMFGKKAGGDPVDATDWGNGSTGWTDGAMISTVDDLLVYGRALGTGEGLLPPEQQAERLNSFVRDLPPLDADNSYGLGLINNYGWIGHGGEVPGFNTAMAYHPELDATVVVEVNSDIDSGDCPEDVPTLTDGPQGMPCAHPADRIFRALAEALGQPAPAQAQ